MDNRTIVRNVDRLDSIKAEISTLQKEYDKIKAKLIDEGIDEAEGKLFKVSISDFDVSRVDYKGVVTLLDPSEEVIEKFTSVSHQQRVVVNAR